MCFSTKSPTILSSCKTAFSAPFTTLRVVRRNWRWFWVAAITPTAPSAAPAAIPSSIPEELFVSCLIFKAPFDEKIRSPALLFPIKYLVSAFFMQKFVVYCVVKFIMGLCARPKPAAARTAYWQGGSLI